MARLEVPPDELAQEMIAPRQFRCRMKGQRRTLGPAASSDDAAAPSDRVGAFVFMMAPGG